MFCKFCGQQIDGGANFCPRCGNRSAVPAPNYSCAPVQAAPVQKPVNGLGIAAFVIGIVSLFFGFFLLILPIVGIVLGTVAVVRRTYYRLNGLAIAGLVISCVACAFWLILFLIWLSYGMSFFLLILFPFLLI